MEKKKRDRPGKRGKRRVIKFIVLFLVAILSVSSFSLIFDVMSDEEVKEPNIIVDSTSPDDVTPIVMPNDFEILYTNSTPLNSHLIGKNSEVYEPINNHFVCPANTSAAFPKIMLGTHYYAQLGNIKIADYSYLKIEFEVFNTLESSALGSYFDLEIRSTQSGGYGAWNTGILLKPIEDASQFTLIGKNGKEFTGNSFKIEYVIECNKTYSEDSRFQTYINGELVGSSDILIPYADWTLSRLNFRQFNLSSEEQSLGVKNLQITGCK